MGHGRDPGALVRVVGLGGTTRADSSSEKAVRAVLRRCEALGATTRMFDGPSLAALPHFAPENPARSPEQAAFVAAVREADAVVVGTPGYHGGVSGLVKNALDLLEDLRGDARPYLDERPVGCIVTAGGAQAGGVTLSALRDIVHALRGWPTPLGVSVNTTATAPFAGETCTDPAVAGLLDAMAEQLMWFCRRPAPAQAASRSLS